MYNYLDPVYKTSECLILTNDASQARQNSHSECENTRQLTCIVSHAKSSAHNAPVICNHCSPSPPPTHSYGEPWGTAGLKCWGNYFSSVPALQGKWQGFDKRILTPGRFSIAKGRAKSKVLSASLPQWFAPWGVGLIAGH